MGPVTALAMLRLDGQLTLARGGADGVTLLDVETTGLIGHLDGRRPVPVQTLAVLDGQDDRPPLLAVGGVDGTVRLWDVAAQKQIDRVSMGAGAVWALTIVDSKARPVIAGVCSGQIRIWDWRNGRVRDLPASGGQVWSLCDLPVDGRVLLVSGHVDGGVQLWDPHSDAGPEHTLTEAHRGSVWTLSPFTMGGTAWLATGGADRAVNLWHFTDLADRPVGVRGLAAEGTVRRLSTIPRAEGDLLASASAAGLVDIWQPDEERPQKLRTLTGHKGEVWSLACARDGERTVVASGDINGEVRLADLRANLDDATAVSVLHSSASTIWTLAAVPTPEGGLLASAGVDSTIQVIDLARSTVLRSLTGHHSTVRALAAGPDPANPTLISGGADGTIRVWDPVGGQPRTVLAHGRGEVWALATLRWHGIPYVASGTADGTVRLWPLNGDTSAARTLLKNAGEVTSLAVVHSGDGPLLACGGSAGLRIIAFADGPPRVRPVFTLTSWALTTITLAGRHLVVSARADGTVVVLDPVSGAITAQLAVPETPVQVRSLTVVQRGADQWIVGGCHDGRILIWHASTGTILNELAGGHLGTVRAVVTVTDDDGSDLYSAGDDGQVRRWALTGQALELVDTINAGAHLASVVLSDQPQRVDRLGRADLVRTLGELLTDPRTEPPVVVGVHAPWGQGKTSVLLQLRELLDPTQQGPGFTEPPAPTHELTPTTPPAGGGRLVRAWRRIRQRWTGGPVRTRLTRSWAWRQVQRYGENGAGRLPYRLRRIGQSDAATDPGAGGPAPDSQPRRITVWFSPWMYTTPDQMWAGLTHELLESITRRLPAAQRDRLWFDLNLRRTDPAGMRRRILQDLIPRSLLGLVVKGALVAIPVVTVVAIMVSLSQSPNLEALLGPTVLITASAVVVLANLAFFALRHLRGALPPGALDGPSPTGMAPAANPAARDWRGAQDPLRHSHRGYLYLVQHDVREVVQLASEETPIVVFIDDLDRCTPAVVSDTIEAINLFLNNAFGRSMFVLALDPATVAAHLETAHEALGRRIAEDEASYGQLRHIGWRFMEKIVELPVRLPRLTDAALGAYVDELIRPDALGPTPGRDAPGEAPAHAGPAAERRARRPWLPRQRVHAADVLSDNSPPVNDRPADAGEAPASPGGEPVAASGSPSRERPALITEAPLAEVAVPDDTSAGPQAATAQVDYVEQILDVQKELREAALRLPRRSPRQTKAFLNLWRFYMTLEYRGGRLPDTFREIAQHGRVMARFVEIVLRFPRLLDTLSYPSPATFRRLTLAAGDDLAWIESLDNCGLTGTDRSVRALRDLLRDPMTRPDLLADVGEHYL